MQFKGHFGYLLTWLAFAGMQTNAIAKSLLPPFYEYRL